MKATLPHIVLLLAGFSVGAAGQEKQSSPTSIQPPPEMRRLVDTLAGDWDTHEIREHTYYFPNGGERRGQTHIRLTSGGATLVMEGDANGSAGPLSYIIVIWWDTEAKLYRLFTCFKDKGSSCEIRGTARWDRDSFVNDYDETVHGRKLHLRDTFEKMTPNSYTLVFAWVKEDGSIENQIITKAVRRTGSN